MKSKKKNNKKSLIDDYNSIMNLGNKTVLVKTEWVKEGDYFQKLSLYNHNYVSIPSLGNTTLIK